MPTNTDEEKLNISIQEAEDLFLSKALGCKGQAFLYDLRTNQNTPENTDLLNGVNYVDSDGNTVNFIGIKQILIYWFYAVFLDKNRLVPGQAGSFISDPEYFTDSYKDNERAIESVRTRAYSYWESQALPYLCERSEDYPFWSNQEDTVSRGNFFKGIKKNGFNNSRKTRTGYRRIY